MMLSSSTSRGAKADGVFVSRLDGTRWSWNMELALSLVLDHMATKDEPRGVVVPDLFRCRAVCKRWKELADLNQGERWYACVPPSVNCSSSGMPRTQLLKCLFHREMDLAQQRRHLAEAYYLVYLQDRMKKEEAEAERRRREDAAPDDDNEMIMRDPGALSYPGVDRAISSFSLFPEVRRPTAEELSNYCHGLCFPTGPFLGLGLPGVALQDFVLACADARYWWYNPSEALPARDDMETRVWVALWLWCCARARTQLEGTTADFKATTEVQTTWDLCTEHKQRLSEIIRPFLALRYAGREGENLNAPLADHVSGAHWPAGNGRGAEELRGALESEWAAMAADRVDGLLARGARDLDSLSLALRGLSRYQQAAGEDVIARHVERCAKHFVSETLPAAEARAEDEAATMEGEGGSEGAPSKKPRLNRSVLPGCARIRDAVERRWHLEARKRKLLRERPNICLMCVAAEGKGAKKNDRAMKCEFKMCGRCCKARFAASGGDQPCKEHGQCHRERPRLPLNWSGRRRRNAIFLGRPTTGIRTWSPETGHGVRT